MASLLHSRAPRARRRARVAVTLLAFAAAGLYASLQATAQDARPTTDGCDAGAVQWGYDVGLHPAGLGFSVTGVRFDEVPPACEGRAVTVVFRSDGQPVGRESEVLEAGSVVSIDLLTTGAVVDAAGWLLDAG